MSHTELQQFNWGKSCEWLAKAGCLCPTSTRGANSSDLKMRWGKVNTKEYSLAECPVLASCDVDGLF